MDRSFFGPGLETASGDGPEVGKGPRQPSQDERAVEQHANCRGPFNHGPAHFGLLRRLGGSGFAFASFCLLAGCVDSYVATQAPQVTPPQPSNMARREGVSPSGATVAVASFAGGPDGMRDRFIIAFDDAAQTQDIVMATPEAADYLVRGYLNAVPEGDGTAVTYVLDIFDANKHRTQRVEDQILLKAKAADPWSVVDASAVSAVAAKSAAALAAVLTNTPEAIVAAAHTNPANAGAPGAATAHAEEDGRTIVAATPPVGPPTAGGLGSLALH